MLWKVKIDFSIYGDKVVSCEVEEAAEVYLSNRPFAGIMLYYEKIGMAFSLVQSSISRYNRRYNNNLTVNESRHTLTFLTWESHQLNPEFC